MADPTSIPDIELDTGSFNAAERREVQHRFGLNFETVTAYVAKALSGDTVGLETPVGPAGNLVFADEALALLVTIERRRTNPNANEKDFEHLSLPQWVDAIHQGRAKCPKGATSST